MSSSGQRVLVTGGAGFIGSHICDAFLAQGASVLVIDDLSSGSEDNLDKHCSFEKIDIRSREAVKAVSSYEPDVLVHAAAQMSVRVSMEQPAFDADVNVRGFVNLLEPLRGRSDAHVVFLSTGGAIYGEQDTFPAPEGHPIRPASAYGLAKRVGELYLDLWQREFQLPSTTLRLANVYGPRQNPHGEAGVVAIFQERLIRGEDVTIFGDGSQTRDFVAVGDVVRAVLLAASSRKRGIFNVGTGVETSVLELLSTIAQSLSIEKPTPRFADARPGEQARSSIDATHAREVLGWQPKLSLEEGMAETARWYRAQLDGTSNS